MLLFRYNGVHLCTLEIVFISKCTFKIFKEFFSNISSHYLNYQVTLYCSKYYFTNQYVFLSLVTFTFKLLC